MLPISIVIPTWNAANEIEACLKAAKRQECSETIVVDNASSDDTLAIVQRASSHAVIVANAANYGFAGACNQGFAVAHGKAVLFLNSDARLDDDYARHLWNKLERDERAASAVGKLVYRDGDNKRLDGAGIVLNRLRLSPEDRGLGEIDVGQYDSDELIFGPSGAAALYRCEALRDVSTPGQTPFDEAMFAYYEDVDLAWRLNRRGWRHWYVPSATGEHERRGPMNKPATTRARAFVNRYLVWAKNESLVRWASYAPLAVAWELGRLSRIGVRNPSELRLYARAAFELIQRKLKPSSHNIR
ncbi:MAG: glycosyltransferase family 2 protein [Clostridia bacterium]|nr:glycosyltransferase family 2 protein [Deltaproteobacteria bacterium]